jgi:hypothetical protein
LGSRPLYPWLVSPSFLLGQPSYFTAAVRYSSTVRGKMKGYPRKGVDKGDREVDTMKIFIK